MLLPLMLILQNVPLPELTISPAADSYVVTAPDFEASLLGRVQLAAKAKAAAYCKGSTLVWRELRYVTNILKRPDGAVPVVSEFRHEFDCAASAANPHQPAPADWVASPTDDADAQRVALSFAAKRDAGDFDAAYDMFDPVALHDRAGMIAALRKNNPTAGGSLHVTGIRWLVNKPDLPYPGAFILVSVIGDYPRLHFYCGYIALYRLGPGNYQVVQDLQSFLPIDPSNTPEHIAAMKTQLCGR